ncbi:uncharacterized protein LOC112570825 [Pomacea canaliculata]|uniref:uncharacterized protein LOC112570825 n=1 Tax=Pomacea canaliculata TaxID=400727 RepID=UPI000D725ACA|nr:uncharacterized protein LOC112570825 [Pomacea canaliculata]
MIVFYRQGLGDRMNLCLFCLGFSDLMYLVTMFIMASYCFIAVAFPGEEEFWKAFLSKYILSFDYGFGIFSGCVTMIIAVERCVCVMFPMKSSSVISTKIMAIILLVTFIVIQLLCSVYIIKEKIIFVQDMVTGEKMVDLVTTELYVSHVIFRIIEDIVLSVISLLSFSILALTTAITVIKLRSAMIWRKSSASSFLKGQEVLIRMLVVVSTIYIFCAAHNVILALTRYLVPEFSAAGRYKNIYFCAHFIFHIPVIFNCSINFFVYAKMSSRFQEELKVLCLGITTPRTSNSTAVKYTGQ